MSTTHTTGTRKRAGRAVRPPKAVEAGPLGPKPVEEGPPAAEMQAGGKLGLLIGLLRRPEGATLADMTAATGWQVHSVRGAMSGALKRRLGLTIISTKADGARLYRIDPETSR